MLGLTAFGLLLLMALGLWALWAQARRRHCQQELARAQREASERARAWQAHVATLDALTQATPLALILLDENGRLVWRSRAAEEVFVRGQVGAVPIFLYPALENSLEQTQADGLEHARQFNSDGSVYLIRSFMLSGPPRLLALTVEDVTELQRLGRTRRDFVANLSHDLRTPIATIQLLVETLQEGAVEKPKKRQKLLDSIAAQTLTLQQMVQELMDLSLIESGRMPLRLMSTPLSQIIEPALMRFSTSIERQQIRLQRAYDPHLTVLADVEILQRVLQNLLHNAIKFTPEGGVITIGSRESEDEVVISVRDTGPGIPAEHLDRIFERFYKTDSSRSSGGSGLGLAIAKHIVEGHGGRIWAESEPGQGAAFYFSLLRG